MKTRKAIVAAFGATALAATAGGLAMAQPLNPIGGNGGAGAAGGTGGTAGASNNTSNATCAGTNAGGTTNIVTRSKSSCRNTSAKGSIRNASNGGKGGAGGKGGGGGNAFNRF